MNDDEIQILRDILNNHQRLGWSYDPTEPLQIVKKLGSHPEEEDDEVLCALFESGKYVALHKCEHYQFAIMCPVFDEDGGCINYE